MAKKRMVVVFMLFITFGYSQKINDSLYYSNFMKIDTLNYAPQPYNFFFMVFSHITPQFLILLQKSPEQPFKWV